MLDRLFKLHQHNTSVRTELTAGLTTFMAMSYIIFVNPAILSDAGMPKDAAFVATVIAASLSTLFMGIWANMPVAIAPGMGINAFFTYTVVLGMGLPWQTALGAVFISGVVFLLLSVTRLRELIINAVPMNLKTAIGVGIGMFIAFIGLYQAGVIVDNKATLVALGDLTRTETLLALGGLLFTAALMAMQVRCAILLGILVTTAAGMLAGAGPVPHSIRDIISADIPSLAPTFMQLDILAALKYGLFSVLFTMTMIDLFDSMGTLIGVSRKAGLMRPDGHIEGLNKALIVDSCGTILSGIVGTPAASSYVESAAGITEGGRTGLTAVAVAVLFALSLFFAPLVGVIQSYATAPALIAVGALMIQDIGTIDFKDLTNGLPAFLTIITMPLTYSIATGFGMGFISYVLIKACTGRAREVNPVMWIVAGCFAINFIMR